MSEFNNVTIVKQANVYFAGKVTSRTIRFPDNTIKSLGIMLPGEYEFGTAEKELMEILSGQLEVLLPGQQQWQAVTAGGSFEVAANAKFKVKITAVTDYCCSYL